MNAQLHLNYLVIRKSLTIYLYLYMKYIDKRTKFIKSSWLWSTMEAWFVCPGVSRIEKHHTI